MCFTVMALFTRVLNHSNAAHMCFSNAFSLAMSFMCHVTHPLAAHMCRPDAFLLVASFTCEMTYSIYMWPECVGGISLFEWLHSPAIWRIYLFVIVLFTCHVTRLHVAHMLLKHAFLLVTSFKFAYLATHSRATVTRHFHMRRICFWSMRFF